MQFQGVSATDQQGGQDIVLDDFVDLDSVFDSYLADLHHNIANANPAGGQPANIQNGFGLTFNPAQFAQTNPQAALFTGTDQAQPQSQPPNFFNSGMPQNAFSSLQFAMNMPGAVQQQGLQANLAALSQQQGLLPNAAPVAGASEHSSGPTKTPKARGRAGRRPDPKPLEIEDSGDSSGADSASSDEPKSRKKRELTGSGDQSVADRRHQALQEKNRRAQRRFRERQKSKIQELHKQIEDLTVRVGSLQNENSALQSRTSILEKVLEMRNEQIQVMQETKEDAAEVEVVEASSSALVLTGSALPEALNPESLKRLTPEEMTAIYQKIVGDLKVRLMELNESQSPQLQQGVEMLVKDVLLLLMRFSIVKPLETRKFVAGSRQSLPSEEDALVMWKDAMRMLGLSEDQKKEMVVLKGIFLTQIEVVMDQRRQLNVQIQAHFPHASFHTKIALAYIKAHEAVAKLKDNLRNEHRLVLEFSAALFKKILTPIQMATLLVQAFPAVPDSLAISSAVASEMGEEPMRLPAIGQASNRLLLQDNILHPPLQFASQLMRTSDDGSKAAAAGLQLTNTGSTEESGTTSSLNTTDK